MIVSKIDLEAKGYKAKLSKKLRFYQGDSLHLSFTIMSEMLDEIDSQEISDGIIPIDCPNIECVMLVENMMVAGTIKEGNEVVFNLSSYFTQEIGVRKLQIKIMEKDMIGGTVEVFHTPPFEYEIAEPICTTPVEPAQYAMVDYAIVDKDIIAPCTDGVAYYEGVISSSYQPTNWVTGDIISSTKMNKIEQELNRHAYLLDELMYKPINITSCSLSVSKVEKGSTVTNPTISWSLSKTPKVLTLNGVDIINETSPYTIQGSFIKNESWNLVAKDEKNSANKTVTLEFLNGKYYGTSNEVVYDDNLILSFNKELVNNRKGKFTVNCGADEHIFFAIPSNFGTPIFSVGGFEGGFVLVETLDFTNINGYTEEYCIYKSENKNLGSTTVVVE